MAPHIFQFSPETLMEHLSGTGEPIRLTEARRVLAHVLGDGKMDFLLKHPLRKKLQAKLAETISTNLLHILERVEDPSDKSVRYLFEAPDRSLIEAVRIPLLKPGHFSICLSSQAGCAMACDFCATGRLGLKRNLETWEILAQFWQIRQETAGRVGGAVFMGQGEPFHNYDHVIRAAHRLSSPSGCRVDAKNITISTVGLVPQIRRYTAERHPFRLIVSLTSALPDKRARLLPLASRWALPELAAAIKAYAADRRERITLAWVLLRGINSGADEVDALQHLMGDTPFILNLIDVNDARADGYQRADDDERRCFMNHLQKLKVPIVRRYSVGNATHSACGMLAGKRLGELSDVS